MSRFLLSRPGRLPSARCALAASLLVLGGCGGFADWLESVTVREEPSAIGNTDGSTGGSVLDTIESYLLLDRQLESADPVRRQQLVEEASARYNRETNISNQLRYAMTLSAPGSPAGSLSTAKRLFDELLASPEKLLNAETHIARARIAAIAHDMLIIEELERLRESGSEQTARDMATLKKRLDDARTENAALRDELEDARGKLDAITSIEQSVERSENEENEVEQ